MYKYEVSEYTKNPNSNPAMTMKQYQQTRWKMSRSEVSGLNTLTAANTQKNIAVD